MVLSHDLVDPGLNQSSPWQYQTQIRGLEKGWRSF